MIQLNKFLSGKTITFFDDSALRQYLETMVDVMESKIHSSDGFSKTP